MNPPEHKSANQPAQLQTFGGLPVKSIRVFLLLIGVFACGFGVGNSFEHKAMHELQSADTKLKDANTKLLAADRELKSADAELKAACGKLQIADEHLQTSCAALRRIVVAPNVWRKP